MGFVKHNERWYHVDSGFVYDARVRNEILEPSFDTPASQLFSEMILDLFNK